MAVGFLLRMAGRAVGTLAYGAVKSTMMAATRQAGLFNPYTEAKRFYGWRDPDAEQIARPTNPDPMLDPMDSFDAFDVAAFDMSNEYGMYSANEVVTDALSDGYDPMSAFGAPEF
jgi:hypothetical protein